MWLPVKEAAELLGISERAIQLSLIDLCEQGKYLCRCVEGVDRGGMQYEILLESLPQSVQDKYNAAKKQDTSLTNCTEKQRELASYRYKVITMYKEFKNNYHKRDKKEAFVRMYNEEHPDEKPITYRQVNGWERAYRRYGWEGLIDRRGRLDIKGTSFIPDDVWEVFKKLWLKESQPTVQSCYDMTKSYFEDRGRNIPGISSFKRRIRSLPEQLIIRYRQGKKAYQDKCMPYLPQNYSNTYSNEIWIADHHIFDVLVVDENGNVFRPWLSGWQDFHSKMIVGYVINKINPNADIVLDSFARACYSHGIPDEVKLDNGKDYKTYDLFNEAFPMSVCNMMNISVTYAIPYNAKAKPIERTFRTLEERYCKHLPSYIGNDPKKRPEKMKKLNKQLADIAMPYAEFKTFVDDMIKTHNTTVHSALKGNTPLEAYKNDFKRPMRTVADKDTLNLFLMRTSKPIKVGRNGIRVPAIGCYYYDDRLIEYQGKEVYARYNAEDIRKVLVFDKTDKFICSAVCIDLGERKTEVSTEYIRELNRRKKVMNKFVREQYGEKVELPTIQEHVAKKAGRYEDIHADGGIIQFNPITYKQAEQIRQEAEAENNVSALPTDQPKKTAFDTRESDQLIAEFYKKAGGI